MISTHHRLRVKFPKNFSTLRINTSSHIPIVLDLITLAIQHTKLIQQLLGFQIKTLRRRLLKASSPRPFQCVHWVYIMKTLYLTIAASLSPTNLIGVVGSSCASKL